MAKEENTNPLISRYPPNSRFILAGAFFGKPALPETKIEVGESCTDKETYRLTMASKRGALGNIRNFGDFSQSKAYMFPDGVYDSQKDFSVLLRKDLSIVELDEIINNLTEQQKNADKELQSDIAEQLALAEKLKQDKSEKGEVVNNTSDNKSE